MKSEKKAPVRLFSIFEILRSKPRHASRADKQAEIPGPKSSLDKTPVPKNLFEMSANDNSTVLGSKPEQATMQLLTEQSTAFF